MVLIILTLESDPSVIITKDNTNNKAVYTGTINSEYLSAFLSINLETMHPVDGPDAIDTLFSTYGKKALVLVYKQNSEGNDAEIAYDQLIQDLNIDDIMYVIADIGEDFGKKVMKKLELKKKQLPHMEIIENKGSIIRTKFEGYFELEDMKRFVLNWQYSNPKKIDL